MFEFIKRLFTPSDGGLTDGSLCLENFSLTSTVKLPKKYETPGGSKVTMVTPIVDIWYSISGGAIRIHKVRLAKIGCSLMGSTRTHNLASKAGEAFYAQGICNESDLREAVSKDIAPTNSPLTRIMFGKWKAENNESLSRPLVDALNNHANPNEIATHIKAGGRGTDITFTYTKPDGSTGLRQVSVEGVSGNSLRARDLADDSVKSFRLDRISNARAS